MKDAKSAATIGMKLTDTGFVQIVIQTPALNKLHAALAKKEKKDGIHS